MRNDLAFELDHVDFEYKKGAPVLHQVVLSARKGEKIAIVGATGSGKTTIASLLLRLYEVTSGTVRVLGRDVRSYGRSELRQSFAVVPQDVYLFPGSIATNVAVGDATLTGPGWNERSTTEGLDHSPDAKGESTRGSRAAALLLRRRRQLIFPRTLQGPLDPDPGRGNERALATYAESRRSALES
jgi:ABC-type transport system involved in cytochrome bd biosynthesis fused ATPase/permease subunit